MTSSLSNPPRANWAISQRENASAGLYALAIIDLDATFPGLSGLAQRINQENTVSPTGLADIALYTFAFNVNPKSMSLEEPAAVTIVPTQNKGMFIEHQGQIFKNINLQGTTGLRPNRKGLGGITAIFGIPNPLSSTSQISSETGLPNGEKTGFDDLMALRNLYRQYCDMKEDPATAPTTIMVWQNGKEGEYYVVEPLDFRTERDASSPLTASYVLPMRTVARLDVTVLASIIDPIAQVNSPDSFFQRLSDARRELAAAFQVANAFVDRTVTIAQAAINNVLAPVSQILQGLTGFISSGVRVFDIPQNTLSQIATNSTELATAFDQLTNNTYTVNGINTQLETIANAYKSITRQLVSISKETQLFTTPVSTAVSNKLFAYSNPLTGLPNTGGSPTDLANLRTTNAGNTSVIYANDTIFSLSKRLLGDAAKWKILVILNQLKPPYISPAGDGVNVFRPGKDQIVYPIASGSPGNQVKPQDTKYTGISPLSQRLGTDMKLVRLSNGKYNIAIGSSGDVDTISGVPNLEQAITIKVNTEQGELPTHPAFGLRFPIGTKARQQSLIAFQLNARTTLLSDRRIGSVDSLTVGVNGNILKLQGNLSVKGFDQALSIDFSVRR